jgi:hypothetical protein
MNSGYSLPKNLDMVCLNGLCSTQQLGVHNHLTILTTLVYNWSILSQFALDAAPAVDILDIYIALSSMCLEIYKDKT